MANDVQVRGLAELQRALDTLPAKIEANIMRGAVRAGTQVLAEAARANVPVRSGRLAESVRVGSVRIDKRTGRVVGVVRAGKLVGSKGKAKDKFADVFYAHMVEYGTAAHIIKAPPGAKLNVRGIFLSSVEHPGAKKRPFMRPALDTHGRAAVEAIAAYIRKRLATKHGIDVPDPDADVETDE